MWDPKDLPEDSLQLSRICLRWSTWCGYLWRSVLSLRSGRPFALVPQLESVEYRHLTLARRRNLGKLSPNTMARTIWRFKGVKSQDVIVGPSAGVDVSILSIGEGRVIVANCDPISLIPSLGPEDTAEMSR